MHQSNDEKVAIYELNSRWKPHPGQIPVGKALFYEKKTDIFVQAGRKWGKTDFLEYSFWRFALSNPNTENYYFAPFQKQAKEILWAPRRLQTFGPEHFIAGVNNSEMRITFTNGSFIKVDGSDNFEAYRGITPKGLIGYDEFKDFRPEFHQSFDPNRARWDCPLVQVGTPPDRHCQYIDLANECRTDPDKMFYHAPTWQNPFIGETWLKKKKAELYARGEGDVWEREYGALYIKGGASKIFPMLSESMIRPHGQIIDELYRDRNKLQWILWSDPAAASCFAVIFLAINPFSKKIYLLDEIYEKKQAEMSVYNIGRRMFQKRNSLFEGEWDQGYDEAETWFMNEILERFGECLHPSSKAFHKKENGISLLKDIMNKGLLVFSDRCKMTFWEMDNYYKDKAGRIPKVDDHLIDCVRYSLGFLNYLLEEEIEYIEADDEDFRGEPLRILEDPFDVGANLEVNIGAW